MDGDILMASSANLGILSIVGDQGSHSRQISGLGRDLVGLGA